MASDVLYDEYSVDGFDFNGDIFLTDGVINTKELCLQDLTQCQDTSSSDSGISVVDDLQDVADISDLNTIFDTDFKDIDFSLDYDFSTFVQDVFDPDILVKNEPSSPEPCTMHHDLLFHDNLTATEEGRPLTLPDYNRSHDALSPASSANSPQQITYTVRLSPQPLSPQYDSPSPDHILQPQTLYVGSSSLATSSGDLAHIHNQPLKSLPVKTKRTHSTHSILPARTITTSPSSIIVLPNIKQEVPILPSSREIVISAIGGVNSVAPAAVNIDSILNSKVKIKPKLGSEVIINAGNAPWVSPNSQVQFSSYQPFTVRTTSSATLEGSNTAGTDDKFMKRAQRIIKNRESASLSRKKKKEYMSSLEVRLQQCKVENERLVRENESLKQVLQCLQKENTGLKFTNLSPAKKMCLMCLGFLLVLNLSPFGFMNESTNTSSSLRISPNPHVAGRHLMSLEDREASRVQDYLKDIPTNTDAWSASLLMQFDEELSLLAEKLNITDKLGNMCPKYFNSTESNRLAEQLRVWMISHEEEKRKTEKKKHKEKPDYPPQQRFSTGSFNDQSRPPASGEINKPAVTERNYPVQVFQGGYDPRQQLLNTIPRRNDTFYVLSFSTDYFLVPATAHNKTMRPRMSLLMPVVRPSINESSSQAHGSIGMMQIDCEILSTNIINVHRSAFREDTYHNTTSQEQNASSHSSVKARSINMSSKRERKQSAGKVHDHDVWKNLRNMTSG